MRRAIHIIAAASSCAVIAIGCATTQLQSSWVKPGIGALSFNKVVAEALSKNPARRRMLEDAMVSEIRRVAPNVEVVAGYTLVPDDAMREEGRMQEALERGGFDGAVMMRITDTSVQDTYIPGRTVVAPVYYRSYWGYYRHWVPIAYDPARVERNRSVQVETVVYSLAGDSVMVYAAVSSTLNPDSPGDLVQRVASVVARDMRDKGLLRSRT
jgi:hypothetical protein